MKKKMLVLSLLVVTTFTALTGCGQYTARNLGGSYTIELEPGQAMVDVAWKEGSLWYLTSDMDEDYEPRTYTFQEDSTFDVMEGTVTIIESKQ